MLTLNLPKKMPVALWGTLVALLLALCVTIPAQAADMAPPDLLPLEGRSVPVQGPRQQFRGDLTVDDGEVIEDDVFIYSGNVEIENGGRITGDLVVFSGNISIDEDSAVEGDIFNYSGNVEIGGHVGGDLTVLNGDVRLEETARIDGDLSVANGNIDREEGAVVSGDVVRGPSFRFPGRVAPNRPDAPVAPGIAFERQSRGFFGSLFGFIGRLFTAAMMTALAMLLVGGLFYVRPQLIADTRRVLNEQLALSAVVGALANLTGLFLAGLLAITICLLPLALIPLLLLAAVNVIGWAVASQIAGERIALAVKQEVQPALTILVGAFVLTGIVALLWAFGGCFRFVAYLLIFVVSSLGAGAVLVPWINRRRGIGGAGTDGDGGVPPVTPTPPGPAGGYEQPVETDVAAPIDYTTAEEINIAQERAAGAATAQQAGRASSTPTAPSQPSEVPETSEVVEHDVAAPIDYVTAEEVNASEEHAARTRSREGQRSAGEVDPSTVDTDEDTVEQDVAAPIDYVTAQEVITTEAISEGDDFMQLKGIGPTYARRLKDGGFTTFAQLAAASPEEVAAAIGWPVDRVRRSEIIDQAKVLARR